MGYSRLRKTMSRLSLGLSRNGNSVKKHTLRMGFASVRRVRAWQLQPQRSNAKTRISAYKMLHLRRGRPVARAHGGAVQQRDFFRKTEASSRPLGYSYSRLSSRVLHFFAEWSRGESVRHLFEISKSSKIPWM